MEFEEVKNRLRAAYITYRRRKVPHYNGGAELEKFLDTTAQNCIAAKVTPELYIEALYNEYAVRHDKFFPSTISSQRGVGIAKAYARDYEKIPADRLWVSQWQVLKKAIDSTRRHAEDMLFDHAMPFEAWFRIVATKTAVPRLIQEYGKEAKSMLAGNPELQALLRTAVPQEHVDRINNYERYRV